MTSVIYDEKINSLQSDLLSYGREITEHISALHSNTRYQTDLLDLKNDPANIMLMLKLELTEILEHSMEQNDFAIKHSVEIKECSGLIGSLNTMSSITDMIIDCEKAVTNYRFLEACELLRKIEVSLKQLPTHNSEIGSGKVCSELQSETKILSSKLKSKLKRCLGEFVRFEHGRVGVTKVLKGVLRSEDLVLEKAPLQLADVWRAIVATDTTFDAVQDLLSKFWCCLVQPVWCEKKPQTPRVSTDGDSSSELVFDGLVGKSIEATEQVSRGDTIHSQFSTCRMKSGDTTTAKVMVLGSCKMALPPLLDCVGQMFSFLWAEMICGNLEVAECVSQFLNNNGAAPHFCILHLLTESISTHLPKFETELVGYRRHLDKHCLDLDTKFKLFGFDTAGMNSKDDAPPSVLTTCLQNLPSIYAASRRSDILKQARDLVTADYHNTMMAAGDSQEDDPSSAGDIGDSKALLDQSGTFALQKLRFDSCQVSLSANRILKLIHAVMRQACEAASSSVTNVLFQSARDCLEIFMAIVPMKFSEVIDATPRMGAVFFNDCLYIAHNTTLITHKYRADFGRIDEILQNSVGFVDFIPRFRSVGEQCLRSHLEDQRAALSNLIRHVHLSPDGEDCNACGDSSGGLALTESVVLNDEQSAERLRAHMERLCHQWMGVLQEDVYCRVMGNLLEGVLEQFMAPLLRADCISAEAGTEISRIFKSIQKIRLLFPPEFRDPDAIQTVCPSWSKFVALTELLEFSLSDIVEWLPHKKFASFSGQEMNGLVRALFENNEKRRVVLHAILSMSS